MRREIAEKLVERLLRLKDDIAASINAHGLTASGRTAASMRVTIDEKSVTLWGRAFFPALETGSSRWTGATGVHCTFAEFRNIIRDWVAAKGLVFGQAREQDRAISAIAMKIIREGTRQKRSGQRLDVYSTLVDQAADDCAEIVADITGAAVDAAINQWR